MFQVQIKKFTKYLVSVLMVLCVLFFASCGPKEKEEEGDDGNLPKVPSVNANDGNLENNGGDNKNVTKDNLPQFVEELKAAMILLDDEWDNEDKTLMSYIFFGKSGRIEGISQAVEVSKNAPYYQKSTGTMKYFNFSGNEKIFLGGALGAAGCVYYESLDVGGEDADSVEVKYNGEIKFNGLFAGSIVYKNYYAKFIGLQEKLVKSSGEVVIKSGGKEIDFKEHWLTAMTFKFTEDNYPED